MSLWIAGRNPAGVAYSLNQSVSVQRGSEPLQLGCVISLDGLEPEPRYLVELTSGETIEVFQRHLSAAER